MRALASGEPAACDGVTLLPQPGRRGEVALSPVNAPDGRPPIDSVDLVFPVLHGTFGEDGTVQGLFELAAVPYAGAGVLGSALGMDKITQKTLWRGLGLPIVDFVVATRRELERDAEAVLDRIEAALAYPVFTKPAISARASASPKRVPETSSGRAWRVPRDTTTSS